MSEFLKGNFQTRGTVAEQESPPDRTEAFEREALKRVGGSIAFVSKKKVSWERKGD